MASAARGESAGTRAEPPSPATAVALRAVASPDGGDPDTPGEALRAPFLRTVLRFPLKKVAIWAAFLALLFALRGWFSLVFLTFVLTYITSSIVARIAPFFSSRRVPVLLVYGTIVGGVVGLGFASLPRAVRQGERYVAGLSEIGDVQGFVDRKLEEALASAPALRGVVEQVGDPAIHHAVGEGLHWVREEALKVLPGVVTGIWAGVLTVLMALLFSFMIVWDAPRLAEGVSRLRGSRLGDVWSEVAPSIATFARLLGRAFEAQTVIALVNTLLTGLGMWALGIPGAGFLSVIVFVCSFVPIVGVFASTVPIAFAALQGGGLGLLLGAIVMVVVVHMLEAYVLNPRIYGHHMRLHPLAVLVVLYVGHHVGVWGLIVGVPLATYVWRHLVMGEHEHMVEPEPVPVAAASPAAPAAP